MASSSNQRPMNAEQLRAITTKSAERLEFQETLRRILTRENSTRPPSTIPAPTFGM